MTTESSTDVSIYIPTDTCTHYSTDMPAPDMVLPDESVVVGRYRELSVAFPYSGPHQLDWTCDGPVLSLYPADVTEAARASEGHCPACGAQARVDVSGWARCESECDWSDAFRTFTVEGNLVLARIATFPKIIRAATST